MHALFFSAFKHPLTWTLIYVGGGPMRALVISASKHPFTLIYVGGSPMRRCLLLAGVWKKRYSQANTSATLERLDVSLLKYFEWMCLNRRSARRICTPGVKFDFIHSDVSAGGTLHTSTRSARLAMVLAISITSTIPAPSTEQPPSLSVCCAATDSYVAALGQDRTLVPALVPFHFIWNPTHVDRI